MVRPVRPKPAASLVITKQKKSDLYVLMGQRPKNSRFAPNVWVFPGGRVEKSDMLNKSIKPVSYTHLTLPTILLV